MTITSTAASTATTTMTHIDTIDDQKGMGYPDSRKLARDSQGNLYLAYRKKAEQGGKVRYHIFVARSGDNGLSWEATAIEQTGAHTQHMPSIAIDSHDRIHIVWYGLDLLNRNKGQHQIKYAQSADSGHSWSPWQNIAHVPGYGGQQQWQQHPTVFVDPKDNIYVAWDGLDTDHSFAPQTKFIRSNNSGKTWSNWANVQPSPEVNRSRPTVIVTGSAIYLLAYGYVDDVQQVIWSKSHDRGNYWTAWQPIAPSNRDQRHISAAVDSQDRLHVVWRQQPSNRDSAVQAHYALYDGKRWQPAQIVSPSLTRYQFFPSITIHNNSENNDIPYIIWSEIDDASDYPKDAPTAGTVYYAHPMPDGEWCDPIRLRNSLNDIYPSFARNTDAEQSILDLVWLENRGHEHHIFYDSVVLAAPTQEQPVDEPVTEPVIDPVSEPVIEPVIEPVTVSEPLTETAPETEVETVIEVELATPPLDLTTDVTIQSPEPVEGAIEPAEEATENLSGPPKSTNKSSFFFADVAQNDSVQVEIAQVDIPQTDIDEIDDVDEIDESEASQIDLRQPDSSENDEVQVDIDETETSLVDNAEVEPAQAETLLAGIDEIDEIDEPQIDMFEPGTTVIDRGQVDTGDTDMPSIDSAKIDCADIDEADESKIDTAQAEIDETDPFLIDTTEVDASQVDQSQADILDLDTEIDTGIDTPQVDTDETDSSPDKIVTDSSSTDPDQAEATEVDAETSLSALEQRQIVRDETGTLYAVYSKEFNVRKQPYEQIFVAKSADGTSWTESQKPAVSVGPYNQSTPAIALDNQNTLHIAWAGFDPLSREVLQIKYARSEDHGESWSPWRNIARVKTQPDAENRDQQSPVIACGPEGTLSIAWQGTDEDHSTHSQIKLIRSADQGKTWSSWQNINPEPNPCSDPALLVTSDDVAHVVALRHTDESSEFIWTQSDDQGQSWSSWEVVDATPQGQSELSLAIDDQSQLYAKWHQPSGEQAVDYMALYDQGGWQSPQVVVHVPEESPEEPSDELSESNDVVSDSPSSVSELSSADPEEPSDSDDIIPDLASFVPDILELDRTESEDVAPEEIKSDDIDDIFEIATELFANDTENNTESDTADATADELDDEWPTEAIDALWAKDEINSESIVTVPANEAEDDVEDVTAETEPIAVSSDNDDTASDTALDAQAIEPASDTVLELPEAEPVDQITEATAENVTESVDLPTDVDDAKDETSVETSEDLQGVPGSDDTVIQAVVIEAEEMDQPPKISPFAWPEVQRPPEDEIAASLLNATYVDQGPLVQVDRRISFWARYFDFKISPLQELFEPSQDSMLYVIKHIFTTRDGSWVPSDLPGSIPQWASATYGDPQPMQNETDRSHYLFGTVVGPDGDFMHQEKLQLSQSAHNDAIQGMPLNQSGWHYVPLAVDSRYLPGYTNVHTDHGQKRWGWSLASGEPSEAVVGGNLPDDYQISIYVVWQAIPNKRLEPSSFMPRHTMLDTIADI